MAWSNYTSEPDTKLDSDFVINRERNALSNHQAYMLRDDGTTYTFGDVKQIPFSLSIKGPMSLRGRSTAYKVTT